ncbi:MAG: ABC transporter ATP-binding protein [Eubacteriales bacterium]|nr:ABC transporter ATP-binding protein [Eubacteriales bacterium]
MEEILFAKQEASSAGQDPSVTPLLQMENISMSFPGKPVLADVSLYVGPAELVSLLGVSGAGKSTLFNLAAGLLVPDQGKVIFKGEDITGQKGKIAYMLQKDLLLPHLTIAENVALPLLLRGERKDKALAEAISHFENFGLAGTENYYPGQLSGGMAQRAAFLRTYLFSSELFLLDEPFSALDAITKEQLHRWFLGMRKKAQFATLLITHDIDEALTLSDRIYILGGQPGSIIEEIVLPPDHDRSGNFWKQPSFVVYKEKILQLLQRDI